MKKNIGEKDKIIRIVLALVFGLVGLLFTSGVIQIVLVIFSLVLLFTAFTNYCLLYSILGINTCKTEDKKSKEDSN